MGRRRESRSIHIGCGRRLRLQIERVTASEGLVTITTPHEMSSGPAAALSLSSALDAPEAVSAATRALTVCARTLSIAAIATAVTAVSVGGGSTGRLYPYRLRYVSLRRCVHDFSAGSLLPPRGFSTPVVSPPVALLVLLLGGPLSSGSTPCVEASASASALALRCFVSIRLAKMTDLTATRIFCSGLTPWP